MKLRLALCALILSASNSTYASDRWYKPQHANAGHSLYLNHCATCHGQQGEGANNWRKLGPDGKYPAPPLNGSGHTWHHHLQGLYTTISLGQNNMPGWKDVLSKGEVLAIIAWFQSQWSDEIYAAWQRNNDSSKTH